MLDAMRAWLFTLMLCGSAAAATTYKWVDADGVTHYSDRPHPGAERIEQGSVQTYDAKQANPVPRAAAAAPAAPAPEKDAPRYGRCEIAAPRNDEALVNVHSVSATVRLEPRLRGGDTVTLLLDGQPVQGPGPSTTFTVSPIDRGTHTLAARIADASGRSLCETASVTFHVRQPSLLQPNRRPPASQRH